MSKQIGKESARTAQPFQAAAQGKAAGEVEPSAAANMSHADVACRAYSIYMSSGMVGGHCEQNWKQAEKELRKQT